MQLITNTHSLTPMSPAPSKKSSTLQSALRAPLNKVLGTETHVRIIRALDNIGVPIGIADLARHIEMDKAGVWRAASVLKELGVVESVGVGAQQSLQLRKQYPLNRPLATMFRAERTRFEKFIEALADVAKTLEPSPKSMWIEGPVATGHDQPGDPVVVGLLGTSSDVGRLAETFSRKTMKIQRRFDIAIEVRSLTSADLAVLDTQAIQSLADVILLLGPPPSAFSLNRAVVEDIRGLLPTLHKDREDQSFLLARAVSERILRDPTIVRRASAYLKRRLAVASPREAKELQEWQRVFQTYSISGLRKLLVDNSERGIRLRQSSPFLAALSPKERAELLQHAANNRQRRPAE
jgi:DNA-binding transcriptional ArsR family regulator